MKKKVLFITMLTIVFFISINHVIAADNEALCNIGLNTGEYKGYGNIQIEVGHVTTSYSATAYITTEETSGCEFIGKWCDTRKGDLLVQGKSNSKGKPNISYAALWFYGGKNDNELLCKLTPDNGGIGVNFSQGYNWISFKYDFQHGNIHHIKAILNYDDNSKPYSKDVKIYKRVGKTGTVKNTTSTTTRYTPTKPTGYYMCENSGPKLVKQECIYYKTPSNSSLKNCIADKVYSTKKECEKHMKTTTVKSTKKSTTKKSATASSASSHVPNNAPSSQAGLKKGSAKTANYDPSNAGKQCDTLKDLVGKYWKYVMFLVPVALIILITVDFVKGIVASDAETLKKSANAALKRTIAAVVLLTLPVILSLILGWFGIDLCII